MSQRSTILGVLLLAIAVLSLASLSAGKVWVPWSVWLEEAAGRASDPRWAIIFDLRLPRTILAVFVGAAMGAAGAALQGYTRNPLADHGILGVSSMAAFGAVLTLYFGSAAVTFWILPVSGVIGAMIGIAVLFVLSAGTMSVLTFILAGVILNIVATAGIALALNLAPSPWAVNEIVNWLMGSLSDRSFDEVKFALPLVVVGCGIMFMAGPALDALTLGELSARSLGISMDRTRALIAIGVGLAVGACVAVTGSIGFVGLVTPHLLRPFVGARPAALLLPSSLGGAVVVLAADIIVRLMPTAAELKLGVAMAAIGAPFFLFLLVRMRRSAA